MGISINYFRPFSSMIFIVSAILFSTHQILIFTDNSFVFLDSYLDDLVVMPIVLTGATVILRIATRNETFNVDLSMIALTFVMYAVIFEFILPRFSAEYTSDYLDILCYGIGAVLYYFFRERA